jgi:hypothetical protein
VVFEGSAFLSVGANFQVERFGVSVRRIERITKVHEEGVGFPTEAVLDVGIGEFGAVKEVASGNAEGVSAPELEVRRGGFEVENCLGGLAK